jgi:thiol-disulfide isomerase/thioredoxin
MKKVLLSLLALAVVGLIAYTTLFDRNAAPQVSYTSLNGQQADTASLKGKVVLVNFWATSCSGCVEEMPEIKKLHQQYGARDCKSWPWP